MNETQLLQGMPVEAHTDWGESPHFSLSPTSHPLSAPLHGQTRLKPADAEAWESRETAA